MSKLLQRRVRAGRGGRQAECPESEERVSRAVGQLRAGAGGGGWEHKHLLQSSHHPGTPAGPGPLAPPRRPAPLVRSPTRLPLRSRAIQRHTMQPKRRKPAATAHLRLPPGSCSSTACVWAGKGASRPRPASTSTPRPRARAAHVQPEICPHPRPRPDSGLGCCCWVPGRAHLPEPRPASPPQ